MPFQRDALFSREPPHDVPRWNDTKLRREAGPRVEPDGFIRVKLKYR
jgi:hypothetical protein